METYGTTSVSEKEVLVVVRALLSVGSLDLLFADLYRQRAEAALVRICTHEDYLAMRGDRERLPSFAVKLRRATEHDDWSRVRSLAEEASALRTKLTQTAELFQVASTIYGATGLPLDASALALTGVSLQPAATLEAARQRLLADLASLADQDREQAELYRSRSRYFEVLALRGDDAPEMLDSTQLRARILAAVEVGDFTEVKSLTSEIPAGGQEGAARSSRARIAEPDEGRIRRLAEPFPGESPRLAGELGLVTETLEPDRELDRYLACPCADAPTFPVRPRGEGGVVSEGCTCGHLCPPGIGPTLREDLDFLMAHPFVNTGGYRYLPWFGAESMLVESFPEDDPDARTPLLDALELPQRRGLSRIRIEEALQRHGTRVSTQLGLDPIEFTVVCIPFDVYVRLSGRHDWGRHEMWTHLDGYQVTRDLGLWGIFGGHARYGGPENLSSLAREYDSEHLTARFVVLRRQRFLIRRGSAAGPDKDR